MFSLFCNDVEETDKTPSCDIAICIQCGWKGNVNECEKDEEGDWESGYYEIDLCPKCNECIDDYDMSKARQKEYDEWYKNSLIDKDKQNE